MTTIALVKLGLTAGSICNAAFICIQPTNLSGG